MIVYQCRLSYVPGLQDWGTREGESGAGGPAGASTEELSLFCRGLSLSTPLTGLSEHNITTITAVVYIIMCYSHTHKT